MPPLIERGDGITRPGEGRAQLHICPFPTDGLGVLRRPCDTRQIPEVEQGNQPAKGRQIGNSLVHGRDALIHAATYARQIVTNILSGLLLVEIAFQFHPAGAFRWQSGYQAVAARFLADR